MFRKIKELFAAKADSEHYRKLWNQADAREFYYRVAVNNMCLEGRISFEDLAEIEKRYKQLMAEHEPGIRA